MIQTGLGHLNGIDLAVLGAYLAITLLLGLSAHRAGVNDAQYLNASQSLPLWMVSISFLAANCGALELLGISATAAQYGAVTLHFYWIGAVPALICLAMFVLPVYARTHIRSVPDYLGQRFDERARMASVLSLLCITVLLSGISLYAVEVVLQITCGWPTWLSASLALLTVAAYTTIGGLRATIYNEILQLCVVIAGLLPLVRILLRQSGGFLNFKQHLPPGKAHAWIGMPLVSAHAPLDMAGLILGLGFVLGFGYWCTDFVQIQRILTTKDLHTARRVPLVASLGKMFLAILVVIPGLAVLRVPGSFHLPYNAILPALLVANYSHGWLGLGVAGILASLISNLSGNASAFSAIWTEEIYHPHLRPGQSARHYIAVGRISCLLAIGMSAATSVLAFYFQNLMEYVQLIFSFFSAPVFGVVLCGMLFPWVRRSAGLWGMLGGLTVSVVHLLLIRTKLVHYGSGLNATFHGAIYAWTAAVAIVLLMSAPQASLASSPEKLPLERTSLRFQAPWQLWLFGAIVVALCLGFNFVWR